MGAHGVRCPLTVMHQRFHVAAFDRIGDAVDEGLRVFRIIQVLAELLEVVGQAARADDQHAVHTQPRRRLPEP